MVGEEALSEDKAQALLGAGHEVTPTWRRLKWPSRGVLASTKRIVGEHFEYVRPTAISKPMWACLHCSWSNTMRGFIRTVYAFSLYPARVLFLARKKCIRGMPSWQAEIRLAQGDLNHFLQKTGPFAAVEYPPHDSDHETVRQFWEVLQPSFPLKCMARHLAALRGSQGATERTWARLSLQTTAVRNLLLPGTKGQLLNIASNWKILYPNLPCVQLERPRKNRDFEYVVPDVQGRNGPAPMPEAREGLRDEECPSSSSSSSSSSSCSEAPDVPENVEE